ncbi:MULTISPECIES: sialidase family protein [Burkholderia]|uniref:exo-alpha-sialidase n=1 Tax=Burkholderia pyrrocinia TaxID=60550 RepID=A0A318J3S4_BURPY|nr:MULTISPECIES: sialidase family protein [Burkholderia]PXX40947.1 BNR/Asp-box repeat protein [Burkholderia pyrrocinia]SFW56856.1 BNR/Asp-box repeat-containing protein [Burkholderia sp. NFACC33-1]SFY08482.1 BNR/Asp-box repeat-containing protein [Burkholderia sp. NFPP32]
MRRTIVSHPLFTCLPAVMALACAAAHADPVLVSGPSPYAACTIGGPGTVYVNAEVEPWLSVNPANPTNMIGVWQQDRWSNGGAHGLVAGYTFDGGATWARTTQPFSACAPGGLKYERASDPWVSFGPDGTAYSVSISFNQSNNSNAVASSVSTDGGQTWSSPAVLIADNEPTTQFFNDKESVTANPVKAGTAYAVWDRLELPNGNPYANLHTQAFRGPTLFSKTTDGGKTWSKAKVIVHVPSRQQTIGNQIVVDPRNGTLYDFFNLIQPPFSKAAGKVAFIKSTDDGVTWTQPQVIAGLQTVGVTDPNTGEPVRTGDIIPEPAIDPASGQLYVVWQDSRFNGGTYDEIALSTSKDGGASWSAPLQINTPTGRPAFNPSVRVDNAGAVMVTHYDFRDLLAGNTTTLPTGFWRKISHDGGVSFGDERRVGGPFDMKLAPNAEGFFIGDYQGLDVGPSSSFHPFFVQTSAGNLTNRTDVFFAP